MKNTRPVSLEEAYNQLNEALNAVRQKHPDNFFNGPNLPSNTLATARRVLQELQIALLIMMDGIDPASVTDKGAREVTIQLKPDEAHALSEFITDTETQPTPDEAASGILFGQLRKLGYLE